MPNIKSIGNVGNENVSSPPARIEERLWERIKIPNLKIIAPLLHINAKLIKKSTL